MRKYVVTSIIHPPCFLCFSLLILTPHLQNPILNFNLRWQAKLLPFPPYKYLCKETQGFSWNTHMYIYFFFLLIFSYHLFHNLEFLFFIPLFHLHTTIYLIRFIKGFKKKIVKYFIEF